MTDDDTDDQSRTDSKTPLAITLAIARETLEQALLLWTAPDRPRPGTETPLPHERALTDGGEDDILDGETGAPLATEYSEGSRGRDVVPDETPPTEAIRIRAGIRPEDHGLKVRECGRPGAWLRTLDHVEVKR